MWSQGLFRRLLLGCVLAVGQCVWAAQPAGAPPALDVTITPVVSQRQIDRLNVSMRIASPDVAAGEPLLRMPTLIVGIPTAAYGANDITARDDQGELTLSIHDEPPTSTGIYRRWSANRATVGNVQVAYGAKPREVNARTRNGPLFDLRAEAGGLIGAGVYFLALPAAKTPFSVSLRWNLSGAPSGWRGVWSLGEGAASAIIPVEALAYSYFMAGPIHSVPEQGADTKFGLYWLARPPFEPAALARQIHDLYSYMAHFFRDEGSSYRIFVRGNPYPAGGGTALTKSFMFGYGIGGQNGTAKDLQMLLAHEMTHNWPRFDIGEHAETAWYAEGTAEYYSALLSARAGVISLDKFEEVINEHATSYYTNPHVALSNEEAGKRFWQDSRAQRVPYGRGFMYLARLDAQIRAETSGAKSLDDLVLRVLERQRRGEKIGNGQWVEMVVDLLGEAGRREFDAMVAGARLELPATTFAPCFEPVPSTARSFDLGFDEMRREVVSGLREGSPGAEAGLKEGDAIVRMTPLADLIDQPEARVSLTYRRAGVEHTTSYLPRGPAVPSMKWRRVESVPDSSCRL